MRPVSVFAKGPGSEIGQLRDDLHGRWREAIRAVIWAALKNYVANTAGSWPGRLRQIHSFFRNRSPDQMLATAAPWTSPWLPPRYEQNFWNGTLARFATSSHPLTIYRSHSTVNLVRLTRKWLGVTSATMDVLRQEQFPRSDGVVAVQLTRQHVVDVLRTAGLPELADEALQDLPDPVDSEQVAAWAVPYGINMGDLVSRVGGSP
jgi:hypothetical protein